MRTARSLPYKGGGLCPGGVSVRGGSSACGQTDACQNITLPQTSFTGGKNWCLSAVVWELF